MLNYPGPRKFAAEQKDLLFTWIGQSRRPPGLYRNDTEKARYRDFIDTFKLLRNLDPNPTGKLEELTLRCLCTGPCSFLKRETAKKLGHYFSEMSYYLFSPWTWKRPVFLIRCHFNACRYDVIHHHHHDREMWKICRRGGNVVVILV
jgi:hypothetical protein